MRAAAAPQPAGPAGTSGSRRFAAGTLNDMTVPRPPLAFPLDHAPSTTVESRSPLMWATPPGPYQHLPAFPIRHAPSANHAHPANATPPQLLDRWWQPLLDPLRACQELGPRALPAGVSVHADVLG